MPEGSRRRPGQPQPRDGTFGPRLTEILVEAETPPVNGPTASKAKTPTDARAAYVPTAARGHSAVPSSTNGSSLRRNQARSPSVRSRNSGTGPFAREQLARTGGSGFRGGAARQPREVGVVDQDVPDRLVDTTYLPDLAFEPHLVSRT